MNTKRIAVAVCAAAALAAAALPAQGIAKRMAQVKDGSVRMSFASRSDVCGNGAGNISTGNGRSRNYSSNGSSTITTSRHNEWEDECEAGPVRVAIDVADGKPARYDSPQVMVGGAEAYEVRCRNCHQVLAAGDDANFKLF